MHIKHMQGRHANFMHGCTDSGTVHFMTTWKDYVLRLTDGENQKAVSARTGIDQATISRWRRGETSPNSPATVAHFAQAYGANVLEAFVAAGFLTEEEAGMPPRPKIDFYTLVDSDPDLSPESKEHIKNQYGLLKAASAHARVLSLREEILHNPNLDQKTKEQLLTTLTGTEQAAAAADQDPSSKSGKGRRRTA